MHLDEVSILVFATHEFGKLFRIQHDTTTHVEDTFLWFPGLTDIYIKLLIDFIHIFGSRISNVYLESADISPLPKIIKDHGS